MTQEEFLHDLGLSREEFRDLVKRFIHFLEPLNEAQRDAAQRSLPTLAEAARAWGPDMKPQDLEDVLSDVLKGIEFVLVGCSKLCIRRMNPKEIHAAHPHGSEATERPQG